MKITIIDKVTLSVKRLLGHSDYRQSDNGNQPYKNLYSTARLSNSTVRLESFLLILNDILVALIGISHDKCIQSDIDYAALWLLIQKSDSSTDRNAQVVNLATSLLLLLIRRKITYSGDSEHFHCALCNRNNLLYKLNLFIHSFIHSYFLLISLEQGASVKRFVSLKFLNLVNSR
jgi:hypothetical protein